MDATLVEKKFARIGARAAVRPLTPARARQRGPFLIDIGHDRDGEFFDIQGETSADLSVLDVQPKDRHLLLMLRIPSERNGLPDTKNKFLCGHDERHWFVAAVPGQGVSSVLTAKEALKPDLVRAIELRNPGRRKNRHRRRNEVFTRQGEWFFLPARDVFVDTKRVLRNEPLQRGRGKPHNCEFLYRDGGVTVHVCSQRPNGLTQKEYERLLERNPKAQKWVWRVMQRNPIVLVRGRVSHADHATIELDGWHRVAMNTEGRAGGQAQVAFLD